MATVKDLLQLHAKALSGLVVGIEETNEDVLGSLYEYYSTTSNNFAQHFTPGSVSGTMAEITFPDENKICEASPDDPLLIGDLSGCGSGSLLLDSACLLCFGLSTHEYKPVESRFRAKIKYITTNNTPAFQIWLRDEMVANVVDSKPQALQPAVSAVALLAQKGPSLRIREGLSILLQLSR